MRGRPALITRALALLGCLGGPGLLSGCVIDVPTTEVLTSLRLSLQDPKESDLGREGKPVTVGQIVFDVQAIGPQGDLVRRDYEAQAFLAAGGS